MSRKATLCLIVLAVGLGTVPLTTFAGDGIVRHVTTPVDGQYYVILKRPVAATNEVANDLIIRHGSTIRYVWHEPAEGFGVVDTPEVVAQAMSLDPRVDYVQEAARGESLNSHPPNWGLDRIEQRTLPLDGVYVRDCNTAATVRAYILDSGISDISSEFGTRLTHLWSKTGSDFTDTLPHGTSVASIVGGTTWGAAPGVQLVDVKILCGTSCVYPYGNDSSFDAYEAIVNHVNPDAASHLGPKVANMSVHYAADTTLENAILSSMSTYSITYVVAAGNENADACTSIPTPGRLGPNNGVITVGATMLSDDGMSDLRSQHPAGDPPYPAWSSNTGSCIDVFAPGSDVDAIDASGTHILFSGTSAATPYVTGIAARLADGTTGWTAADIESNVKVVATSGVIDTGTIGAGSPNLLVLEAHWRCHP
jgi:hypothetical protein